MSMNGVTFSFLWEKRSRTETLMEDNLVTLSCILAGYDVWLTIVKRLLSTSTKHQDK